MLLFDHIAAVLDPEPHSAALNMALDEALLQRARQPTVRVYGWRAATISFGYFGRYPEAERAAAGREMVRRWTGGGLVPHTRDGEDLTYTLIVPRDDDFFRHTALESYRLVHEQIAQWLANRGMAASVAPRAAEEASTACFASHVRYDIVAGAMKLAGAAQRRTRWGLLHQGSIQFGDGTEGKKENAGSSRLSQPDTRELAGWFARTVREQEITPDLLRCAEQIAAEKYATEDWLRKF